MGILLFVLSLFIHSFVPPSPIALAFDVTPHRRAVVTTTHRQVIIPLQDFKQTQLSVSSSPLPFILTCVVGGAAPTPFVVRAIKIWYKRISLPKYTPPDRIFAPVWTLLYATIGYSFWKTARSLAETHVWTQRIILCWFLFHYILNISWAPIFFGCKNLRLGHALNVTLIITLYALLPVLAIYTKTTIPSLILIPYAIWLAFATRLSHDICLLNPTDKSGYNNAKLENDIYKLRREAGRKVGLDV